MARKSKAKFKMKGHSIPGIKGFKSTAMPDGRAASSAFQMQEAGDSPNKFVGAGLIGAGIGALSKTKFGKGIGKGLGKIGKVLLGGAGQIFGGGAGEEKDKVYNVTWVTKESWANKLNDVRKLYNR